MRKEVKAVYYCEFCGKHMLSAGAMTRHENGCNQNPNNWHKCFKYCINLIKSKETVYVYDHDREERVSVGVTHFTCKAIGKGLYSYKLEKKCSNPDYFKGLERMPIECDHYLHDKDSLF